MLKGEAGGRSERTIDLSTGKEGKDERSGVGQLRIRPARKERGWALFLSHRNSSSSGRGTFFIRGVQEVLNRNGQARSSIWRKYSAEVYRGGTWEE